MSTNKVYGDNPNFLPLIEKKTRWEIKKNHKFYQGIDENMSVDDCTHSFFGASKTYADLIVQEYGKNVGLKLLVLELVVLQGLIILGHNCMDFYPILLKLVLRKKNII